MNIPKVQRFTFYLDAYSGGLAPDPKGDLVHYTALEEAYAEIERLNTLLKGTKRGNKRSIRNA